MTDLETLQAMFRRAGVRCDEPPVLIPDYVDAGHYQRLDVGGDVIWFGFTKEGALVDAGAYDMGCEKAVTKVRVQGSERTLEMPTALWEKIALAIAFDTVPLAPIQSAFNRWCEANGVPVGSTIESAEPTQ